jgi:hypothetical protein
VISETTSRESKLKGLKDSICKHREKPVKHGKEWRNFFWTDFLGSLRSCKNIRKPRREEKEV